MTVASVASSAGLILKFVDSLLYTTNQWRSQAGPGPGAGSFTLGGAHTSVFQS